MQTLIAWLVYSVAILITGALLPGVAVANFGSAVIVALLLGIMNALVRPLLLLLTLPINILTLGLFTLVINALLILLVARLVKGFRVDGFLPALLFGFVLAIVSSILFSLIY